MNDNCSEETNISEKTMLPRLFQRLQLIGHSFIKKIIKFTLVISSTCLLLLVLCLHFYDSYFIIVVVLLALAGLFCRLQEHLLYHPNEPLNSRLFVDLPSSVGLPYEDLYIKTRDGCVLNLYFMKQPNDLLPTAPTIVFFHGNAGNIGHRLLLARAVYELVSANVLLVDYRGYGKSSGFPSEQGFSTDAETVLDFILQRNDINTRRIFVHGSSLGGAVGIYIASLPYYSDRIAGLMLENTFTCLPDIGRSLFGFYFLKYLPQWVFSEQYPSKYRIQKMTIPTLFLSGLADNLVPPSMMDALYLKCSSRTKIMVRFEAGSHNDTWLSDGYYEAVSRFIMQITKGLSTSAVWSSAH